MSAEFSDKLEAFKHITQLRFIKILDSVGGTKDLIIDSSLMKTLERFVGIRILRAHGVDKIFKFDKKEVSSTNNTCIYLTRGDLITVKRVCAQINSSTAADKQYHLVAYPKIFHSVEVLIEEEGLYEKLKLHSFNWELISLDYRIFSMECPEAFKFLFTFKDETYIEPIARSIWTLQHIFGKSPFKMFLGSLSKSIGSMINLMNENIGEPDTHDTDIGLLLLVDRDVDYVSPLLAPLTYTALVSDFVGINSNVVEIAVDEGKPQRTVVLSSEDNTYNQIKHKLYSEAVLDLKKKISEFHAEQNKRGTMSVQQMKDFVKYDLSNTAKAGQIISNHLHIAEQVMTKVGKIFEGLQNCQHDILVNTSRKESINFIEDLIANGADYSIVLRLLCLISICQNGLSASEANSLKMQFLQSYGHEHLITFHNLEKIGLNTTIGSEATVNLANKVKQVVTLPKKGGFQMAASKLWLLPELNENSSSSQFKDLGYAFGGIYIPVIVQIVKLILMKEKNLRDLLKCLPIEGVDVEVEGRSQESCPDINPRTVWVFVVGGITYAEIAAFALLEKISGCRIIASGSSIINGTNIVQSTL